MRRLGTHLLLEMAGCKPSLLDDAQAVSRAMTEAAREARATVLGHSFHKFSPQGVSGVVVIAESHLSIHTWPEFGYAAVDVFTCGDRAMPARAAESLIKAFRPTQHELHEVPRGIPAASGASQGLDDNSSIVRLDWRPPVYRGSA